jgi:N-acetylneuraminic acid mutarotase
MRTLIAFLLTTCSILSGCKEQSSTPPIPTWSQLSELPSIFREQASSFSIGSNAYIGLGLGNNDGRYRINVTHNDDFWEFNSVTKAWRRVADFKGGKRSGATSFAINGRGYVAFGYSTICPSNGLCDFTYYDDIWEFNPSANSWSKVATYNSGARYAGVFVINSKAYILIGNECVEFDPSTYSIRKRASNPGGGLGVFFALNDKGYVLLGDPDIDLNRRVYEYDPKSDIWTRKNDFPGKPRILPTSFSINGYGYCGGGYQRGNPYQYFKDFWKYDPTTDKWTQIEDYPGVGVAWLQSMTLKDNVMKGSGHGSEPIKYDNKFWLFQTK